MNEGGRAKGRKGERVNEGERAEGRKGERVNEGKGDFSG